MATVLPMRSVKPNRVYGLRAQPAKLRRYALHLLALIEAHFANQPIFTREDCLHIAFLNVATTTRYQYVCESVRWLEERKQIHIFDNRVDLALPANKNVVHHSIDANYIQTVARLVNEIGLERFDLNDVLRTWKSDQLLTTGTKRTVLRACMRRLVTSGALSQIDDFTFGLDTGRADKRRHR